MGITKILNTVSSGDAEGMQNLPNSAKRLAVLMAAVQGSMCLSNGDPCPFLAEPGVCRLFRNQDGSPYQLQSNLHGRGYIRLDVCFFKNP